MFRFDQLPLSAPNVANAAQGVETSVSPMPYVRTVATNGDHDATAETPTAATATTASGADENDDDTDDEHEYVNTETDNNIESKRSHSYDTDKHLQNTF